MHSSPTVWVLSEEEGDDEAGNANSQPEQGDDGQSHVERGVVHHGRACQLGQETI